MSRLTRDGTAEPVSRDQILRHARGQGNVHFPCSADHEQDWQPYPVDPYSAICDDHTYIHTYCFTLSIVFAVAGCVMRFPQVIVCPVPPHSNYFAIPYYSSSLFNACPFSTDMLMCSIVSKAFLLRFSTV